MKVIKNKTIMENEELKNKIIERFKNLQPEIQNIILEENYGKDLYNLAQKYQMNPEQITYFEINTTLLLIGDIHPDEYKDHLAENLKIDQVTSEKIKQDVFSTVLKDVIDIIRKNFEEDDILEELVKKDTEEIPAPPYAEKIELKDDANEILTPDYNPPTKIEVDPIEEEIKRLKENLAKREIINREEIPNKITPPVQTIPTPTTTPITPAPSPQNLISEQLSSVVVQNQQNTNYEKTDQSSNKILNKDPYHEDIV